MTKPNYMERALRQNASLEEMLKPENPVEVILLRQTDFREGLLWGRPRFGHPEGRVVFHIKEVLNNVDKLQLSCQETRRKLRLIAFTHDSFKHQEDKSRHPRDPNKHHGVIARKYTAQFIDDPAILNILEWHDEAYYIWRLENIYRDQEASQERLKRFLTIIGGDIQLYYLFFVCDTRTGDKNQAPLKWFEKTFSGISPVKI